MSTLKHKLPSWLFESGSSTARWILYPVTLVILAALAWCQFGYRPGASVGDLLSSADLLAKVGSMDAAEERAREVLIEEPENLHAQLIVGMAAERRDDHEAAIAIYERCVSLTDDEKVRQDLRLSIGDLRRRQGRPAEAQAALDALERDCGPLAAVERLRGILAREAGDAALALHHFMRQLELAPGDSEAEVLKAASLIDLNRCDEAESDLDVQEPTNRHAWPLWQDLAEARFNAGDELGARRALEKLFERDARAQARLSEDELWQERLARAPFDDLLASVSQRIPAATGDDEVADGLAPQVTTGGGALGVH
ncbi:MAG: tetratricopeptide repeat protein [Planctomycetes bacterium]|nr:tetratricopeptide repeat protein [Planctomycetota bacterium]